MASSARLHLARAWRDLLRRDRAAGRHLDVERRCDVSHCAQLRIVASGGSGAAWLVTRLGETLRLVQLATATYVDPVVLNALWDADEVCAVRSGLCTRCDVMDRDAALPSVTLSVQSDFGVRTGVGMIHDALYAWQEDAASSEFRALREALTDGASVAPTVEIKIELGMARPDEDDDVLRDVYALLSRIRDAPSASGLCVTHVLPVGRAADAAMPFYAPLRLAIADADACMPLAPLTHVPPKRELMEATWQWLFDWTDRTKRPPRVDTLFLTFESGMAKTAERLLKTVVATSPSLQRLVVCWPPQSMTRDERHRAAAALGATLLAPHASISLSKLELDLGDVTSDDVVAMQQGIAPFCDSLQSATTEPRFQSVEWKAHDTNETVIAAMAQLLGTVGVQDLRISLQRSNVWVASTPSTLTCRTLKTVLEGCAGSLRTLHWGTLSCDDALELEAATAWTREPSQLRELSVSVLEGSNPATIRALDALLARVGGHLTNFSVAAVHSAIGSSLVDALVAHCPRLRRVGVAGADAGFYEALALAMDRSHTALSALSVVVGPDKHGLAPVPLLEALQDPTRGASRTLRSLEVGNVFPGNPQLNGTIRAFVETMVANTTLVRATLFGSPGAKAKRQLQSLRHQFGIRLPSARRQLALLSVCECHDGKQRRLAKLPLDALMVVFAFAGRRVHRYKYDDR